MAEENKLPAYWALKAAEYVVQYINENPPDVDVFAQVIEKCYDKYSRPQPEPVVEAAKTIVTQPVHAPEDFDTAYLPPDLK